MAMFSTLNAIMAGGYQPPASDFDGTVYLERSSDLSGLADSSQGIFMAWFRSDANLTQKAFIQNGNALFLVEQTAGNAINIALAAAGSAITFNSTALASGLPFRQILASWDTNFAAGARLTHLYISDVSNKTVSLDSGPAFNVDYTSPSWTVGSQGGGALKFNGCLAEVYFAAGQYLDLSVTANRRKFITAGGEPLFLGATGSLPTGIAPSVYLRNPSASFGTNSGTGGNFTITGGSLTACSSSP